MNSQSFHIQHLIVLEL